MTETVAEIIGDKPMEVATVAQVEAPRHPGQPAFPDPGIYFGMPEDQYHSIFAFSASGAKKLAISSMDAWANSVLNLERKEPKPTGELSFMELGRAYHARICEGPIAFYERYYVGLDREDARLAAESQKKRLCFTVADIRAAIDEAGGKAKGTNKDALIEQLLEFDADAMVWDRMVAKHEEDNKGKIRISPLLHRRIEIAAAMIAGDPQLKDAFAGGHAEVSVFFYDEETGVPCKARFDYLKLGWLVDLKSFSNKSERPVQRAIDMAIAYDKHYLAVAFYLKAIAAVKKLIRDSRGAVHLIRWDAEADCLVMATGEGVGDKLLDWAWQWAHQPEPQCLWIYQKTGVAPVTRGRLMVKGSHYTVSEYAISMLLRKWARCAQTYGVLPWVDTEPVCETTDEEIPQSGSDYGDISYGI